MSCLTAAVDRSNDWRDAVSFGVPVKSANAKNRFSARDPGRPIWRMHKVLDKVHVFRLNQNWFHCFPGSFGMEDETNESHDSLSRRRDAEFWTRKLSLDTLGGYFPGERYWQTVLKSKDLIFQPAGLQRRCTHAGLAKLQDRTDDVLIGLLNRKMEVSQATTLLDELLDQSQRIVDAPGQSHPVHEEAASLRNVLDSLAQAMRAESLPSLPAALMVYSENVRKNALTIEPYREGSLPAIKKRQAIQHAVLGLTDELLGGYQPGRLFWDYVAPGIATGDKNPFQVATFDELFSDAPAAQAFRDTIDQIVIDWVAGNVLPLETGQRVEEVVQEIESARDQIPRDDTGHEALGAVLQLVNGLQEGVNDWGQVEKVRRTIDTIRKLTLHVHNFPGGGTLGRG